MQEAWHRQICTSASESAMQELKKKSFFFVLFPAIQEEDRGKVALGVCVCVHVCVCVCVCVYVCVKRECRQGGRRGGTQHLQYCY
jgi:hypothetical protein